MPQALDPSMGNPALDTEFKLWAEADQWLKSYVVKILHWFHYRPGRLKASWKQEEVLAWELLRALDVLPQRLLLRPLLERIASSSSDADAAVLRLRRSHARVGAHAGWHRTHALNAGRCRTVHAGGTPGHA